MARPEIKHEHKDRYGNPILVDHIVAFCYSGGNQIHLGRVVRLTAKRVRIHYTYEYTGLNGVPNRWTSDYQAHPGNILVLSNIEQHLTMMALKGQV
jgi:hypothetical protein